MGGPSFEVACIGRAFANKLSGLRALDVGSGDGRNCTYLAALGYDVTAIEKNSKLSEILTANAKARKLAIEVFEDDLQSFVPYKKYDVVLFLGILHFLPRLRLKPLLQQYQNSTSGGGVHIITISHSENEGSTSDLLKMQGHVNSADCELIRSSYSSWNGLAYERYVKFDCHNNGIVDRHPIEKFVFQKGKLPSATMRVSRVELVDSQPGRALLECFSPTMLTVCRYNEVCEQFGTPDLKACTEPVEGQYSLLGKEPQIQSVAFWGRTKCYFEGETLIGLARYDSEAFFSGFSIN